MRGAWTAPAGLLVALGALVAGARCTYAPDPASGTLPCSKTTRECPEGYSCDATNFCIKPAGATGTAGTGGGGAGGKGPPCAGTCTIKIDATLSNATAPVSDDKLVGHWVYDSGSTEVRACSDGSDQTNLLEGDYVDVSRDNGNLTGTYYCPWTLTTGPGGNATVLRAGQSCSRNITDTATGTTKYTWHGTTFTFTSLDGKKASLASMIAVDYIDDPTKTGCTP